MKLLLQIAAAQGAFHAPALPAYPYFSLGERLHLSRLSQQDHVQRLPLRYQYLLKDGKPTGGEIAAQAIRPAHRLKDVSVSGLPCPAGGVEDVGNGLAAHAGDGDHFCFLGGDVGKTVAQTEGDLV